MNGSDKWIKKPMYIDIYERIKRDIESGLIAADERLPSKRVLAERLSVSIITVQNAYAQLIAEGYVHAEERRGYFASAVVRTPAPASKDTDTRLTWKRKDISGAGDPGISIDISSNTIDSRRFPFSVWSKKSRTVLSEKYDVLLSRLPNKGLYDLRKEISRYLHNCRGITADPDQIIIGSGSDFLYNAVIKLLGRDKIYAIEDPGYRKIFRIYNAEGVDLRGISLDECGMRADLIEKEHADVVHISPSHNFPTGIVMPAGRRMEILDWACSGKGRYIIEDDYDSEFRFTGRPLPTMLSSDTDNRIIYINTFSKTIAPSFRVSYMILPQELLEIYSKNLGFYTCPVCSFDQYILAEFMKDGSYERHINRMRRIYRQRRDEMMSIITGSEIGRMCEIKEEAAGLHFMLRLDTEKSDEEIKYAARIKGLGIAFLSDYTMHKSDDKGSELLVNYSGIEAEDMKKAVKILADIIR